MPLGDRTGPLGMGPMTGRGAGFCAGYSTPGYANPVGGRGFGMGRGGGRGRRNWFYATGLPGWARTGFGAGFAGAPFAQSSQTEVEMLKNQAEYMENSLDEIRKRIGQLEEKQNTK